MRIKEKKSFLTKEYQLINKKCDGILKTPYSNNLGMV